MTHINSDDETEDMNVIEIESNFVTEKIGDADPV